MEWDIMGITFISSASLKSIPTSMNEHSCMGISLQEIQKVSRYAMIKHIPQGWSCGPCQWQTGWPYAGWCSWWQWRLPQSGPAHHTKPSQFHVTFSAWPILVYLISALLFCCNVLQTLALFLHALCSRTVGRRDMSCIMSTHTGHTCEATHF